MRHRLASLAAAAALAAFGGAPPVLFAASTEWPDPAKAGAAKAGDPYAKGLAAAKAGEYEKALPLFEQANAASKDNPDVLNMLAFTQRKLGRLDDAFANYRRALDLRPKFPEAREYLGEAHLQALLLQIEMLEGYGAEGKEQARELKNSLAAAAAKLAPAKP
ncbi:MAG: tetratricopeptide repeat protein [Elusimicrobia bacterium]|nr:tetratricopeptide repeat protein [Elusimicrobiota bacterium]